MKKTISLILLAVIFLSGCETFQGMKKDAHNAMQSLKRADASFRENWW